METTQDNDQSGGNGGNNKGGDGVGYGDAMIHAIGEIDNGDGDGDGELSCGDIEGIGGRVGTSHNGPTQLEPSCPMANHGVPPFLIKLYLMVDDKTTNSIISWRSSCTTFIITDERQFISQILPCYFKTNRLDSFISQLNNYGFKKKEMNRLEFEHVHFQQGKLHLLKTIKRRKQQSNDINEPCVPINELKATFDKVRLDQKQINNRIQRFKYDIEQTLTEAQTTIEAMINKPPLTIFETVGRKRTFLDIDMGTHFVDIEKDFQSISHQYEELGSDVDCSKTLIDLTKKVTTGYSGEGGRRGARGSCRIPKFLHKLYTMVANEDIDDLISWNLPCCDSFTISDINKFATHVLPMYFKHTNFSSFNSQLNIYGFKKVCWEKHEYANEWFRRGRYDLLANIKRRSKSVGLLGHAITEVQVFNYRLAKIQQNQENKIIWLSNYEEQIKTCVDEFNERVINMANDVEKIIQKSSENLENVKKAKLEKEKNIIGNESEQEPEVNEVKTTLRDNNNLQIQPNFHNLEIDPEVVDNTMMVGIDPEVLTKMMMEDPWFERCFMFI